MQSTGCGSAMFSYQPLGKKQAQEILVGCAGLHNKIFEGVAHSLCIIHVNIRTE